MRTTVAQYITKPPVAVQLCKDDKWEEAWIIQTSQKPPSKLALESYLQRNTTDNIAIELVFQEAEEKVYILGLFFNNHLIPKTAEDFLRMIMQEAWRDQDFTTLLTHLDQKLVGQTILLTEEPDMIRLGVVNHWFSVGPCLIWEKGWSKDISPQMLDQRLQANPQVMETDLNYQGLSFIFNLEEKQPGLCHLMKAPCSLKAKNIWNVDPMLVLKYLQDWQNFIIQ
jgi:hypothetical protein